MKAFLAAIMFLTRIPIPKVKVSKEDWQKSAIYFPLVGLVIGSLMLLACLVLDKLFPSIAAAFLIVLFWIWITGGLHIDGWMDLADGLGSSRTREEILEIMKDSRVGSMGVIAAICLILGKWVAVFELMQMNLPVIFVFSPFYARFLLIAAIKLWPYRKEGGLGQGLSASLTWPVLMVNFGLVIALTYWLTGLSGILLFVLTAIASGLFIINIYQKLKMLTGDCYGAIVEWSEVILLFLALVIWRFAG